MRLTKKNTIIIILVTAILAVNISSVVLIFCYSSNKSDSKKETVFPDPDIITVYNGDAVVEITAKYDYDYIVTDINKRINYLEYFDEIESLEVNTETYIEYKYSELKNVTFNLSIERRTVKVSSIRFILTGNDHGRIVIVTDSGEVILEKLSPNGELIKRVKNLTTE